MNVSLLYGRLTKDVELRSNESGVNSARFTLAVQRNFKNKDGNYDSDFISCIAYRSQADFINKYFHKGDAILIQGRIATGSYKNKEDKMVYTTDVIVEGVSFVGSKKQEGKEEQKEEVIVPQNIKTDYQETDIILQDSDLPF